MKPRLTEDSRKYSRAKNIIIDECSMLTTDTFHALIMSLDLKFINRIILIGDPYQLPPIGPGRAFSDLCHYLNCDDADANLKSAITYLRTVVRTIASGDSDVLTLASWFSGNKPEKFADEIFWKSKARISKAIFQFITGTMKRICLKSLGMQFARNSLVPMSNCQNP